VTREAAKTDARARFRAILRSAGLKCTQPRLGVLRELEDAVAPVSHHEMLHNLARFHWDSATIFRNLKDLCEAGLVNRIDVGDHMWRFELRQRDGLAELHPHFLCVACENVTCLHELSLADVVRSLKIAASVEELLIKGRCADCQRTQRKPV
jgi:Fur family ferric uptake transcriptional regulator